MQTPEARYLQILNNLLCDKHVLSAGQMKLLPLCHCHPGGCGGETEDKQAGT